MTTDDWLHKALDIKAPWHISHVIEDAGSRRIDLWVSLPQPRTGWFFSQRPSAPDPNHPAWRHLNIGGFSCYIHANPHETGRYQELPWLGDNDQPFTRALAQQLGAYFKAGLNMQAICPLLDISAADLWKFKHDLDHGHAYLTPMPSPGAATHAVPAADHPVWQALLEGSSHLDIRVLSLKLLLTKLRDQVQRISDSEVRLMKAHELQRYFVRHAHLLEHELAQLNDI